MTQHNDITLAADVVGFRDLKAQDPERALLTWRGFNEVFHHFMARHLGNELSLMVEASYLAIFPGALEAIACAVELQQDLAERRLKCNPAWRKAWVRIGVNDRVSEEEGSVSVPAVDYSSSRLLSPAEPGGICMSRRVFNAAGSQLDRGNCLSHDAAPDQLWRNLERLWSELDADAADIVHVTPGALDRAQVVVRLEDFRRGDVYIDYPYEEAKFRFEKATSKVYRRFYGKPETEIPHDSELYHEAISAGKPIARREYFDG